MASRRCIVASTLLLLSVVGCEQGGTSLVKTASTTPAATSTTSTSNSVSTQGYVPAPANGAQGDNADARRQSTEKVAIQNEDFCNGFIDGLQRISQEHLKKDADLSVERLFEQSLRDVMIFFKTSPQLRAPLSVTGISSAFMLPSDFDLEVQGADCTDFNEIAAALTSDLTNLERSTVTKQRAILEEGLQLAVQSLDIFSSFRSAYSVSGYTYGSGLEVYKPTAAGYEEYRPETMTVLDVLPCSPFQNLHSGDRIYKINGREVKDASFAANVEALDVFVQRGFGQASTPTLTLEYSNSAGQRFESNTALVLGCYRTDLFYHVFDSGVAYMALRNFREASYTKTFLQNLQNFDNDPRIHSLVVDLRHNPGGNTEVARDMIDGLIDKGPTIHFYNSLTPWLPGEGDEDPQILKKYTAVTKGQVYKKNVFLLVGEFSVSAAEVMASALQAYGVAIVLGTPTKGKGVSQDAIPFSVDFRDIELPVGELRIAESRWFAPDGYDVHRRGVRLDFVVDDPIAVSLRTAAQKRAGKINPTTHQPYPYVYIKDNPDLDKSFIGPHDMSQPDFKPQFERLPAGMQAIASALQNLPANYCIDKPDCELAKTLAAIEAYVKVHK